MLRTHYTDTISAMHNLASTIGDHERLYEEAEDRQTEDLSVVSHTRDSWDRHPHTGIHVLHNLTP